MNKYIRITVIFLFLSITVFAQSEQDATLLLKRYKYLLLADTSFSSAKSITETNADGMWPEINYADTQPGVWQAGEHLRRLKTLAQSWSIPNSPAYHSVKVKDNISRALNHWLALRYKNKNWWHNEIGIPQLMRDIIVLMEKELTTQQLKESMEVMGQYKVNGTGANLVWSADLGLHYGALTKDFKLMKRCRDTILSTIKITTLEGVQPDYSFLQHGRRLQMYSYGESFLRDNIRLAWQLRGSSIPYPPNKIQILTDFLLNGWQWMARGIQTVPGTIDRSASRRNALRNPDIRRLMPLLYAVQPENITSFKRMLNVQEGKASLKGYRYFPYADFTSYHQPAFSFFIKTNSSRTLLTEAINYENIFGDLLNSGDTYFISDGTEYFNLMPVWDWDRLPGITNFPGDRKNKIKQQHFVGNVSNGESGLAIMDYRLEKDEQSLTGRKFWAAHNNVVVALISGLKSSGLLQPAFTVMNQCRWSGKVTVDHPGQVLNEGTKIFSNLKWIHHSNFVYIPIVKSKVIIKLTDTSGRWTTINQSEQNNLIRDKVFLSSIEHDQHESSSGYVVANAKSPLEAAAIAKNPSWGIIFNDEICQAVKFNKGPLMAAFYASASRKLKGQTISVSKPCLILIQGKKLFISDPSHVGGEFSIKINDSNYTQIVPADGTSIQILLN